ncbi:MAG: ATP-binding protein, partial [Waterburya sp.]
MRKQWVRCISQYYSVFKGGASIIFLFGPTGVGKTTLLRQIMKVMLSEKTARLERDLNYLPVATAEAPKGFDSSFNGGNLRNGLSHRAPESG